MATVDVVLKGVLEGFQSLGATVHKVDATHIYLVVPEGSEMDDAKKLKRAVSVTRHFFNLGIKTKIV